MLIDEPKTRKKDGLLALKFAKLMLEEDKTYRIRKRLQHTATVQNVTVLLKLRTFVN